MSALSAVATLPLAALASPSIAYADRNGYSRPDLAARFEDLCARFRARWEYDRVTAPEDYDDPNLDGWTLLSSECAVLGKEILNMPVASLDDIVLQARASALENNDMWRDKCTIENMDLGRYFTRQLIDRICQFAGVPIFGDETIAPVIPLVAAAAVMPEDDRLFSETNDPSIVLAQEARQAFDRAETQYLQLSSAKKAMAQWELRNPRPVMREVTFPKNTQYLVNERIRLMNEKMSDAEIDAIVPDPNADMKAAIAEHSEAIKIWKQQWSLARRQSGVDRAETDRVRLTNAFDDAVERLDDVHATTWKGLVAKARAADQTKDGGIAWSLVRDLAAFGGRDLPVAA